MISKIYRLTWTCKATFYRDTTRDNGLVWTSRGR